MSHKKAWDETIRTMLVAVVIAIIFRSFLFEPFHIPSGSMKSNLLVGDYLFVSKYTYGYSRYSFPLGLPFFEGRIGTENRPKRGDVVVFRPPLRPRIDFIKRVIGLPGDRLQMKHGRLFINGEMLPEEVVDTFHDLDLVEHTDKQVARFEETLPEGKKILILKETDEGYANNTPVFTVPEHHYFMMGDNRDNSQDSRFAEGVGFVPEANIVGRAEVILFSMNGEGQLWEFWKWMDSFRGDRFVKIIR